MANKILPRRADWCGGFFVLKPNKKDYLTVVLFLILKT